MKSRPRKKHPIDPRTPFRVSAYEKRKRDRLGVSFFLSIALHGLLFLILFFMPVSFDYIAPTITLEIWQPGEEPLSVEITEIEDLAESYAQQARLAAVVARYKELQYNPLATADPPIATRATPPIRTTPRAMAPSTPLFVQEDENPQIATPIERELQDLNIYDQNNNESQIEEDILNNEAVIGAELAQILDGNSEGQWLGETLMNLYLSKRVLLVNPDLGFLSEQAFTSKSKAVRIQVNILSDGTVEDAKIIFPGTGNGQLDQRLRLVFLQVLFNDVTPFGRGTEVGTIVLNFKG
ncbi:MAG: hypothetical protein ACRCVN_00105 [Spirochaetia bacterium]